LMAAAPATAFLGIFFLAPIILVLAISFEGPHLLDNYAHVVSAPVYLIVMANTFKVGALVTAIVLVLGYPVAYLCSTLPSRHAATILALVALPWFTSILVRSYSWIVILGQQGIINKLLIRFGMIEHPLALLYNAIGVDIAMIHILLPYMILTLYGVMRGIDRRLLDAAAAAGAPPWRAFLHVYIPLSLPGVAGGSLLVFIMAIGFYVTPALLGSPQQMMMAQMIASEMLESLNWGLGTALATLLFAATILGLALCGRFINLGRLLGGPK
jgi:putative spermidine/putrescine transport system permease protein